MEEGDRGKLEIAAREEAAQTHFDGVGGHVFSILPFDENDENDENSAASSDDGGEDNITEMLDREAAEAKESKSFAENIKDYQNKVTGAAEDPEPLPQLP